MKIDIKKVLSVIYEYVAAFFFPPCCSCCGDCVDVGMLICSDCMEELERLRITRPRTLKYKSRKYTLNSVYRYVADNAASEVATRAKYRRKLSAARFMGALIAQKASRLRADYDIVTYVPMTVRGELNRGYNQCDYISYETAKILKLPQKMLLIKQYETKPQHLLTAKMRRENLDGVYKARRGIAGKRILLIDDIITTGTTLCECADTLYNAGAKSVTLISFAMVRHSH